MNAVSDVAVIAGVMIFGLVSLGLVGLCHRLRGS